MEERIQASKPYFFKVLQDYQKLGTEIADLIDNTEYTSQFIAEKLKIPISDFYYKRRTKQFTPNEIIQIINLLSGEDDNDEDDEDDDELIDKDIDSPTDAGEHTAK